MSQLFEATALVVPFEKLRMTDVESVGGKNASLGEMISQLADTGADSRVRGAPPIDCSHHRLAPVYPRQVPRTMEEQNG